MQRHSFHFKFSHLQAARRSGRGTLFNLLLGNIFFVIMNKSDSSYVLPASLQPCYCRYVGDTFTCFTQVLTNHKNFFHNGSQPKIKSTVEHSNHKTLPFLDFNCTINQDNSSTSKYRKKNIHQPWY